MAIVSDICRFLEDLAPLHLAEKWDNVGLLLGRDRETVKRLMTCLTLTLPVADEAIAEHAQMIVTHHPILFHGTKKITDQSIDGQLILRLAEAGIAVYCPHTAFDNAEDGINHQLAEAIGLSQITYWNARRTASILYSRAISPANGRQLKLWRENWASSFLKFSVSQVAQTEIRCRFTGDCLPEHSRRKCHASLNNENY